MKYVVSETITSPDNNESESNMSKLFASHFSDMIRKQEYADLRKLYLTGSKRMITENPARCWFGLFNRGNLIAHGYTPGAEDTASGRIDELTRLVTVMAMLPVSNIQYSYLIEHPVLGPQVHVWTVGDKVAALEPWQIEDADDGQEDSISFSNLDHGELMENSDLQQIMSKFGTFNSVFIASTIGRSNHFVKLDPDVNSSIDYLKGKGYEITTTPLFKG